jgi:cell division protein FtsI/penicillin-binding protein 2
VGGYRKVPAEDGRDLVLTINRTLQFIVEKKLNQAVSDYGARGGVVIIMEPRTGAILAMASNDAAPDPEAETKDSPKTGDEPLRIDPIALTYEPGSVLKALTMSAAIDTNTVKPQTTFMDSGPITVSGYTIDNWDGKHHGEESMIEVLQHSNNIGAAWVAQKLGAKTLRDYFLRFGLGKPTGIDLEGEDTGVVKDLSEWRPIDLATASFGQGVSVTPLQLTRIFAAIANGGELVRPFVVLELHDADRVIKVKPEVVGRPISKKSAEIMVEMLTAAVEGGEAKYYNIKTHKVAGKTGTAQIPVGGRYDPRKTNATFVGFLPHDPRFVMLVMLRQPSSSIYAAETAVPLWMDIARELIVYYGIEPDK